MVDTTIQQALSKNPEQRFQSATELRDVLEAALREPEVNRARRRRVGFGLLAFLAVGIGAVGVVGARNPQVRERARVAVAPVMERLSGQQSTPPGSAQPASAAMVVSVGDDERGEVEVPSVGIDQEVAQVGSPDGAGDAVDDVAEEPVEDEALAAGEAEAEPEADGEAAAESAGDGDDEAAEGEPETALAAAGGEAAEQKPASDPDLDAKILAAQQMMDDGRRIKGFEKMRRLGRNHRKNPVVLEAWSKAAIRMKAWGEAHRVARQWAEVDDSAKAQIHYARMQKSVGKRQHAITTLKKLLTKDPENREAREMMHMYAGTRMAKTAP